MGSLCWWVLRKKWTTGRLIHFCSKLAKSRKMVSFLRPFSRKVLTHSWTRTLDIYSNELTLVLRTTQGLGGLRVDIPIRVDRCRIFGKLILFGYGHWSGIFRYSWTYCTLTMTAEFINTAGALVALAIAVEKVSSRFLPPVPLFAPMPIKPYRHNIMALLPNSDTND